MDSFEEVLDSVSGGSPKSVLIGNGFSMAFDADRFGYTSLLEEVNFDSQKADIEQIFKELDTSDFEVVIGGLERVKSINNLYGGELDELERDIGKDQKTIRDSFLKVLCNRHPDDKTDLTDRSDSALDFIKNFADIFTTNYDLLLYWIRLDEIKAYNDGFGTDNLPDRSRVWSPKGHQNIHHLHGSLCLYENEMDSIKFVRPNGKLMDQARKRIENGGLPLIVFEGTSEAKRQRIESSQYLRTSHRRLREKGGTLFTYGFAFSENDQHIVEHICGGFDEIHIGLFKPTDKSAVESTLEKARKSLGIKQGDMPTIGYYDSSKVDLWSSPAEEAQLD